MIRMPGFLSLIVAVAVGLGGLAIGGSVPAQDEPGLDTGSETVMAEQIQLTKAHITSFVRMQTALIEMAEDLDAQSETPDPKLQDKLEQAARDSGFASFDEYDRAAVSITLVMAGLDPDTGVYTDPKQDLRADLEEVKTEQDLTEDERKVLIADLEDAIATTPDVAYPQNVDIVKANQAQIEAVFD